MADAYWRNKSPSLNRKCGSKTKNPRNMIFEWRRVYCSVNILAQEYISLILYYTFLYLSTFLSTIPVTLSLSISLSLVISMFLPISISLQTNKHLHLYITNFKRGSWPSFRKGNWCYRPFIIICESETDIKRRRQQKPRSPSVVKYIMGRGIIALLVKRTDLNGSDPLI